MIGTTIQRRIKYQEELDSEFGPSIAALPGGENLARCIQCGTCSSTCPLSIYMDFTPRRIIAMTREGFKDEVLASNTIWLCASCYSCTVECPKEIKITDIMYSLKQRAISEGRYPKRFPIPVLAKEFFKSVLKTGRSNEGRVVTWVFLKTNPLKLFKNAMLGLRLLRRGRMSIRTETMGARKDQMTRVLEALDNGAAKSSPR